MSYRTEVVPRNAPPVQVQETRRAFYAGAKALFDFIGENITQTPKSGPSEVDMNTVGSINQELNEFCQMVVDGKA